MKESSGQEPRKSIIEMFYEIKRKAVKKKITGNLGFIIETEDKLICYVEKEKCRNDTYFDGNKVYYIDCTVPSCKDKELLEKYNLDKKIVYVLDGLTFNEKERVVINGVKACEIQIKNSKFKSSFSIFTPGNCFLKNTVIELLKRPSISINAGNLVIDRTNIQLVGNSNILFSLNNGVKLKARDTINIVDSNLVEQTKLYIESNLTNISNSNLRGEDITLDSKTILFNNSLIETSGVTTLNVKEFNGLTIKTLVLSYNDKILIGGRELVCLKPIDEDLSNNRQALLLQLKEISEKLNFYNKGIVNCVEEKLNSSKVGKTYARIRERKM